MRQFKKAGMGVQRDAPKTYASVPTRASLRASYTCTVAMVKSDLAKRKYEKTLVYAFPKTFTLLYDQPTVFRRCVHPQKTAWIRSVGTKHGAARDWKGCSGLTIAVKKKEMHFYVKQNVLKLRCMVFNKVRRCATLWEAKLRTVFWTRIDLR